MALIFPTDAAKPEYITHGAGRFYIGAYVAAGADASPLRDMGSTLGGIGFDPKRGMHLVEVDQYLGPIASFPIKEDHTIKVTLLDATLANIYKALAYSANTLTGGDRTDNSGQFGLGEETKELYYQIVWKGTPPSQSTATARILQLYKCSFEAIAEIKFEKAKESAFQLTFRALSDPSVSTANKVGVWKDA